MRQIRIRDKTKLGSFFGLITFFTVLTQLPFFVSRNLASNTSIVLWTVAAFVCICSCNPIKIKNMGTPLKLCIVFFSFIFIAGLINDSYWQSGIPRSIILAMFVFVVGNILGSVITEADLNTILHVYALATVILAVDVYFEFFRGATISRIYIYNEKNSTAILLLTGLIIFIYEIGGQRKSNRKQMKTILYFFCCLILTYCIIIMQCRAVFVSLAIVLFLFISISGINTRLKVLIILAITVALVYFFTHGQALDIFMNKYIYVGRSSTDLNDLSSGRSNEWAFFWNDLGDGFLLGNGHMKRESLVLTAILEFGFIFGTLVLCLALYPLRFGFKNLKKDNSFFILFISISCSFITNMFFEQLAPFGPGAKCFLLWFLLGIFSSWNTDRYKDF